MLVAHQAAAASAAGPAKKNVRVVAVEGTSDDLDEPIAEVFQVCEWTWTYVCGGLEATRLCMRV